MSIECMIDVNQLRVASPCSQSWHHMSGDEKKRFCDRCEMHVYDFSQMTEAEIETLLSSGKRTCARLRRRQDGRVVTRDCPIGKKDRWRSLTLRTVIGSAAACIMMLVSGGVMRWCQPKTNGVSHHKDVVWFTEHNCRCPSIYEGKVVVGEVKIPPEFSPATPWIDIKDDILVPESPEVLDGIPCIECNSLGECETDCSLNQT